MAPSLPRPLTSDAVRRGPVLTVLTFDPDRSAPADDWSRLLRAVAERQDCEAFARLFEHFAPRIKRLPPPPAMRSRSRFGWMPQSPPDPCG